MVSLFEGMSLLASFHFQTCLNIERQEPKRPLFYMFLGLRVFLVCNCAVVKVWSFFQNPQWSFQVPAGGLEDLLIFLESPNVSVNVRVFNGAIARPEAVRGASTSGAYRRGCCFLQLRDLAPGPHVVIVSSFRSGICAPYRLAWHSSKEISFVPQPHPFVDGSLAHPLKSLVQPIQVGRSTEIQLRLMDFSSAAGPGRMSVRLQTNSDQGCCKHHP